MSAKKRIQNFLEEMVRQDNRGTRDPFFYVIRTSIKVPAPMDCCSGYWYFCPNDQRTYDTKDEYIMERLDLGDTRATAEKMADDLEKVGYNKRWVEQGMFLTESDAEKHLRSNRYHYSQDAHTFVKHAWRSPMLEQFLDDLYEYFEVNKRNA